VTAPAHHVLVRPHVADLRPVVHGSVSAAELAAYGRTPADVVDFSVNTNPLGPAPEVLRAVADANWMRYPGDDEAPLRHGLARLAALAPDQVALGNGSAELMWLIALATLRPDDTVAVVGPTFGEYARAARVAGAHVVECNNLADLPMARVAFVCNPNNPTGSLHTRDAILRLLGDHSDTLLVLDEAYVGLSSGTWPSESLLADSPNLIILRSLTKDHALPGLRLGYLLASADLARAVEAVRPPWSVNAGALRAGLAMLEPSAQGHVAHARSVIAAARQMLTDGFTCLGYPVAPSLANFVLVHVGDGAAFRRALLPHALVVRDAASFGLPHHVRVACRLPEDCQRLLEVVATLA